MRISTANALRPHTLRREHARPKLEFFIVKQEMGKGRKAIPDQLKKLRGEERPSRLIQKTDPCDKITDIRSVTSSGIMKLLPTKRAKDLFKKKSEQLIGLGILTMFDLEHLAAYCNSMDVMFDCLDAMREPAIAKYDQFGNLTGYVKPPGVAMYKQMLEDVNRLGAEFGFTPLSRQKINVEQKEEKKSLAETIAMMVS